MIKAINRTKFHNNKKLNSLFQIRAINYIINNEDSLIHIFIDELIKLISNIDKKYLEMIGKNSLSLKIYDENEISSNLDTSRITNTQNKNYEKRNNDLNLDKKEKNLEIKKKINKTKKIKYKLKIDFNKMSLRGEYKTKKEFIENYNKKNNYNNNEIYYKFPGLPILGYKGYIPQNKLFYGISKSKIIKIVYNNGLYLKNSIIEKESNITTAFNMKKNIERIIIDCDVHPLTKKEINYKTKKSNLIQNNKKKLINDPFYDAFIIENKNKGKKSFYKIIKEFKEIKKIFLNEGQFKEIFKHSFLNINNDLSYISFNRKKKFNNRNENDEFPNIFDSLFTIKKVGYDIGVIQNDISEILNPYLEEEKFKLLVNHNFRRKTKEDIPENWKKLLSLNSIYPAFRLNKLQKNNSNEEEEVGIVKLHKDY